MAETVSLVGAGFLDELYSYAADVEQAAQEATVVGLQKLQEGLTIAAAQNERWAGLADQITTFSQDGRMVVGVPGGQFSSEAEQAEYGDASHPPAPLFRTSQRQQNEARQAANEHMEKVLGRVDI